MRSIGHPIAMGLARESNRGEVVEHATPPLPELDRHDDCYKNVVGRCPADLQQGEV